MAEYGHTRIVSKTPGRTRIKLSARRRNAEEMSRIASALGQRPLVKEICTNLRTGSIVLQHEHGAFEDIKATFEDLGVILAKAADIDVPMESEKTEGQLDLSRAIADLNDRLGLSGTGVANLRVIVPLGFGALSLIQLLRHGLELHAAPWYVLAYAAFDSFYKLNHSHQLAVPEEQ